MTVLIGIPGLYTGGTENQTLSLVRALVHGGYRVVVASYYGHFVDILRAFLEAGAEVESFSTMERPRGGWKDFPFLYCHLRRCVKKYKPDIAHIQYIAPGAMPTLILKSLGIRRIFVTAHTDASVYRSLKLVHFLQRNVVDVFTCITEIAEKQFFGSSHLYTGQEKLPPHTHITIHNALPLNINLLRTARPVLRHPTTIGVVSRLSDIKGMDLIIPAFNAIYKNNQSLRLLIVGDGPLRGLIEEQIHSMSLEKAVSLVGRKAPDDLQYFYDLIDIFWMPSRSEGFGLSALEAMARGCAVIASAVGGLPELMLNGKAGKLVTPGSPEALISATEELVNNMNTLRRYQEQGLKRASLFTDKHYRELILNLYDKEGACTS